MTRANGAQDSETFREAVEEALGESVSERVSSFLDDHWHDFFSLADEYVADAIEKAEAHRVGAPALHVQETAAEMTDSDETPPPDIHEIAGGMTDSDENGDAVGTMSPHLLSAQRRKEIRCEAARRRQEPDTGEAKAASQNPGADHVGRRDLQRMSAAASSSGDRDPLSGASMSATTTMPGGPDHYMFLHARGFFE